MNPSSRSSAAPASSSSSSSSPRSRVKPVKKSNRVVDPIAPIAASAPNVPPERKPKRSSHKNNHNNINNNARPRLIYPRPLVDTPGHWGKRREFPFSDRPGIGFFSCTACHHAWVSARGWRDYRSGCQKCESEFYPTLMWINEGKRSKKKKRDAKNDPPHDQLRCGKCQALGRPCSDKVEDQLDINF